MAMGTVVRGLGRLFASGTATGMSERQLLDRFVERRDEAAFEALVARHGPMVLAVCRRLLHDPNDVDDAFQATFLVLVRKAGSLRQRDLLANWLFGVAYRVSTRARATAARRHQSESSTSELVPARGPSPVESAAFRELLEEVRRLPERYRAPIVLCDLEGLTHEEAAAQLGWPVGSVKGRLSRARDLLRARFTRRGLDPAASVVAPMWGRIVPPAPLVSSTVKAAALAVVGETSAVGLGLISAEAFALSQGVIHAMTLTQLKAAFAAVALTGTMLTGAGVYAYQSTGSNPPDSPTDGAVKAASATTPDAATKPSRLDPLTRLRKDANVVFAEHLSDPNIEKSVQHVDRLYRWSQAIKESQEYITQDSKAIVQACKDHLDRMTLLHQFTQRLTGPDQPAIADAARASKEFAAREHAFWSTREDRLNPSGPDSRPVADGPFFTRMPTPTPAAAAAPVPPTAGPPPHAVSGLANGLPRAEPPVAAGSAPVPPTAGQPPQALAGAGGGGMMGGGFGGGMGGMGGGFMGGGGGMGGGARNSKRQAETRLEILKSAAYLAANDKTPSTVRTLRLLDAPIPMNFDKETALEDIINYVKQATNPSGKDVNVIPVYVDPKGLQEAGATLQSSIVLDLEGVPLKTTLRLMLKQIDLAYCVRDGVLIISSVEGIHQELEEANEERDLEEEVEASKPVNEPAPKREETPKNPQ